MSLPLAELRERLPGLVGERVDSISQGWDSEVHVVDGRWVVRVPRRPQVAAEVRAEIALLSELAPTLPVAVPEPVAVGPPDAGWFAYRFIDGRPIQPGAAVDEVAAFLSALHRFPVERAVELGLRSPDWQAALADRLDEFSSRVAPLLDPDERARALDRFAAFQSEPANFAFRPAVIHADLGPEHLLCGPDGRLVGVIDWTDAQVGDPALDFAWLLTGLGERFASDLLAAYDGEVDESFRARVAFFHLLGPWHEVLYGVDFGLPNYVDSGLVGVRERLGP
jgi:aminoglycoside phosphotransferase (APT) family kinase protein